MENPQNPAGPLLPEPSAVPPQPAPLTRRGKILRLLAGFFGFFLVNGLLALLGWGMALLPQLAPLVALYGILVNLANVVGLIVLAVLKPTRWFALGILAALVFLFVLSLLAGLLFAAYCFFVLAGQQN